jgi:phosphatidylserine/phosphatidylglycerophosphate/cardiolipin synthase-like enzyme
MTARDIAYLADLIEGGRLTWPPVQGEIRSLASQNAIDDLERLLMGAAAASNSLTGAVWFLREIAAERSAAEVLTARVQAVVSGPRFVPDLRETDAAFREIIAEAKHDILITGFALHNGRTILAALAERMDRDPTLSVVLCLDIARPHGDTSDEQAIIARFAHRFRSGEWPPGRLPTLYYDPRSVALDAELKSSLHAKVAIADSSHVLIGSANLTEAAFTRNIEIGVLISLPVVAAVIRMHIETLIRERVLQRMPL